MRYFITGSTGFIGSVLLNSLRDFSDSIDIRHSNFPAVSGKCSIIHAANSHFDKLENSLLTNRVFEFAKKIHAERIYIFTSFSTLTGNGRLSYNNFNLGYIPTFLDDYARGKYNQELQAVKLSHETKVNVTFVYLPAVIGYGGSWDKVFKQISSAKISHLPQTHNFNFCSIEDVVGFFKQRLSDINNSIPCVERIVINKADSRSLDFCDFAKTHSTNIRPIVSLTFRDKLLLYVFCRISLASLFISIIRRCRAYFFAYHRPPVSLSESDKVQNAPVYKMGFFYTYVLKVQDYIPSNLHD